MAQPKSSKQKRAAQNRASRQALAARRENAQAAASGATGAGGTSGGRSRGFLGRLFNPTPPAKASGGSGGATAPRPARGGAAAAAAAQPPGYRAALSAIFASVAAVVLCATAVQLGVDGDGDLYTRESLAVEWARTAVEAHGADPEASADELVEAIEEWTPAREEKAALVALWPSSVTVALPVIASVLGFRAVKQRLGSKKVNRMAFLMILGAFVTVGLMTLFLPAVIALGVAGFQVRKWEVQQAVAAAPDPAADGIVEAEVVEAEVVDADVVEADVVDVDEVDADDPDARDA